MAQAYEHGDIHVMCDGSETLPLVELLQKRSYDFSVEAFSNTVNKVDLRSSISLSMQETTFCLISFNSVSISLNILKILKIHSEFFLWRALLWALIRELYDWSTCKHRNTCRWDCRYFSLFLNIELTICFLFSFLYLTVFKLLTTELAVSIFIIPLKQRKRHFREILFTP